MKPRSLPVAVGVVLLTAGGIVIAQQPQPKPPAVPTPALPTTPPAGEGVSPPVPQAYSAPPNTALPAPGMPYPTPAQHTTPAVTPTPPPMPVVAPTPPPMPDDMTVEQLLVALDRVQNQKAMLEQTEKAVIAALKRKADKLNDRLEKLGVEIKPERIQIPPPELPPATPTKRQS